MNWKTDTLLGQQVAAPMEYQPGILMGIDRALGRQLLSQLDLPGLQQGHDDWHVFELSWLEVASGRRCVGLARLRFNAASPRLIESKSLKLFLTSFRNHGSFHEDCTITIARRLVDRLAPRWLRIGGYWYPRGGIPIDVFWQTGAPPKDLWLPDQGVATYRGRG